MDQGPRYSYPEPRRYGETEPPITGAILAGAVAAVLSGIVWALIVAVTNYEVGFIAWGIGLAVGVAMAATTQRRDKGVGSLAVAFAVLGLLAGKFFIGELTLAGAATEEIVADPELMIEAVAFDMQANAKFSEPVQAEYDALAEEDTLSDALWDAMLTESAERLQSMNAEEQTRVAEQYVAFFFGEIGTLGKMLVQFSLFDLLWLGLAISTAWKIMSKEAEGGPEPQPEAA